MPAQIASAAKRAFSSTERREALLLAMLKIDPASEAEREKEERLALLSPPERQDATLLPATPMVVTTSSSPREEAEERVSQDEPDESDEDDDELSTESQKLLLRLARRLGAVMRTVPSEESDLASLSLSPKLGVATGRRAGVRAHSAWARRKREIPSAAEREGAAVWDAIVIVGG